MKWEPIDTAPKDGTVILVYREDAGIFTAHHVSPASIVGGCDYSESWFTTDGEDLTDDMPTHWMPLPEPPTYATYAKRYLWLRDNRWVAVAGTKYGEYTVPAGMVLCRGHDLDRYIDKHYGEDK